MTWPPEAIDKLREGFDRMANGNGNGNGYSKVGWEWFWRLLSVLVIPWAMWISVTLVGVKERVAVMEGNRFTSSDGLELTKEMAKRPTWDEIRASYPPAWLVDRIDKLEKEIHDHEVRTRDAELRK